MYKPINKFKVIRRYMESWSVHTGAITWNWEDNTSCIYIVESKRVTPRVKHINIPVYFYKKFLTMVSLFQNMRSLVQYRQICAPNYLQVQLSIGVIYGWLESDYIQRVIQNTINTWYYMSLLWTKQTIKVKYYVFTRKSE